VSEARREARKSQTTPERDRFEESDRTFFERVEKGFLAIAKMEPDRVKVIDATGSIEDVEARIWKLAVPLVVL
jgi:dTMP kinase